MSEEFHEGSLLDRLSSPAALELQYEHSRAREREILDGALALRGGDVLSVGCGWNPGRHLFPAPEWRMTGVELDGERPRVLVEDGTLDEGFAGRGGELDLPDESFDVVLYRLVLHHIAYQGSLRPVFEEAARLLRPGGALIAVEPGSLHPVGVGLALANRAGLGVAVHGTPDDIPLSPGRLEREATAVGLKPEVHAVTYTWRRMPETLQRAMWPLDRALGARPRAARLGHTLMLVARRAEGRPTAGKGEEGAG